MKRYLFALILLPCVVFGQFFSAVDSVALSHKLEKKEIYEYLKGNQTPAISITQSYNNKGLMYFESTIIDGDLRTSTSRYDNINRPLIKEQESTLTAEYGTFYTKTVTKYRYPLRTKQIQTEVHSISDEVGILSVDTTITTTILNPNGTTKQLVIKSKEGLSKMNFTYNNEKQLINTHSVLPSGNKYRSEYRYVKSDSFMVTIKELYNETYDETGLILTKEEQHRGDGQHFDSLLIKTDFDKYGADRCEKVSVSQVDPVNNLPLTQIVRNCFDNEIKELCHIYTRHD